MALATIYDLSSILLYMTKSSVEDLPTTFDVVVVDSDGEAQEILERGDPVRFIEETVHEIHVGDNILIKSLISNIGCQMCINTSGLHPGLNGESGKGKSYACRAMFHLLPERYKRAGSYSNKSFFHMGMESGTVIFLDDIEKLPDELERMIKVTTSQYQEPYTHYYTDLTKKEDNKLSEVSMPSRICWWLTSVEANFDTQILNRCLTLSVDESEEQDLAVMRKQLDQAKDGTYGFETTPSVLICRRMIEILKDDAVFNPIRVKIPFTDFINWHNPENRRNLPMFLDTIRGFTAFYQYQRPRDKDGAALATINDFYSSKIVWNHIERGQVSKLNKREMAILQIIIDAEDTGITRSDLIQKSKVTSSTLTKSINGIKQPDGTYDGGLLNKVKGLIKEDMLEEDQLLRKKRATRYYFKGDKSLWENFTSIVTLTDVEGAQKAIDEASYKPQ
jgi:DNA-binding MarR family transcriptional regulator